MGPAGRRSAVNAELYIPIYGMQSRNCLYVGDSMRANTNFTGVITQGPDLAWSSKRLPSSYGPARLAENPVLLGSCGHQDQKQKELASCGSTSSHAVCVCFMYCYDVCGPVRSTSLESRCRVQTPDMVKPHTLLAVRTTCSRCSPNDSDA